MGRIMNIHSVRIEVEKNGQDIPDGLIFVGFMEASKKYKFDVDQVAKTIYMINVRKLLSRRPFIVADFKDFNGHVTTIALIDESRRYRIGDIVSQHTEAGIKPHEMDMDRHI